MDKHKYVVPFQLNPGVQQKAFKFLLILELINPINVPEMGHQNSESLDSKLHFQGAKLFSDNWS